MNMLFPILAEADIHSLLAPIYGFFSDPLFIFVAGLALLALFFLYLGSENDRVKRNMGTFFILGLSAFSFASLLNNGIRYGIDISGGVSFTLQVKPNIIDGVPTPLTRAAMDQACMTITDRLDSGGTNEVSVMPQGEDKILIQIPETDPTRVAMLRDTITRIAHLELLPVHPDTQALAANGIQTVAGHEMKEYEWTDDEGVVHKEVIFVTKRGQLSGRDISSAHVDMTRKGYIAVTLSSAGASKMWAITQPMRRGIDRLAIVLDGKVVSAPVVQQALGKEFSISGLDDPGEAENLAKILSNPLTNEIEVLEERNVSATLGMNALEQGESAGLAGLFLCFVFVFVYYKFAGLVAIVGLTINALILLGAMSLFGFVLTLPGIAGIVLTLGVAVDANVLIYERMREEYAAGRGFRVALRNSYDKAFSAIFDSNITSLITAVILFWLASGTIKGFAVTTTVGILTSMVGALVVTRVLFFWADRAGMVKTINFLDIFKNIGVYDFLGKRRLTTICSIALLAICIISAFMKGERSLGIDFTGGASITYDVPRDITDLHFKEVEAALATAQLSKAPTVQEFKNPTGDINIIIRCADQSERTIIQKTLLEKVPAVAQLPPPSVEVVGALMGKEFFVTALLAIGAGMLGIMVYLAIRYEWSFALGALISIVHDVVLVLGLIILMGNELNIIHVGAILTLAGYSINDTIIIFDRIREYLRFSDKKEDIIDVMNEAINTTLSRTMLTSTATLAVIACLYFFGGPAMQGFSLTIFIGIIVGTYSSIYIAAPCVLLFSRRHGLHTEVQRGLMAEMGKKD